jgi:hypothetical protein
MRTRLTLVAGTAALALAGSVLGAAPAMADLTGDTGVTFEITAGATAVAISVPESKDLGSARSGTDGSIVSQLGTVTVTDDRAALAAAWTVSAATDGFTHDDADDTPIAAERVEPTAVAYAPGNPTYAGGGTGTYTPTPVVAMTGGADLVGTYAGIAGSRTVSWDPELTLGVADNQVAGTYSGTVTHSVTVTV